MKITPPDVKKRYRVYSVYYFTIKCVVKCGERLCCRKVAEPFAAVLYTLLYNR